MEEGTSQAKHPPPPKIQTQAQGTSQGQSQPTTQGQTAAQGQNKTQGLATAQGTAQGHTQGHQGHAQGHAHGDVESIHNMQEVGGLSDGGWLCCLPCAWLRRNTSVHKASLSFAMLLVMSLLVASPVLFLMSSAPSGSKNMPCKNKVSYKLNLEEYSSVCNIISVNGKKKTSSRAISKTNRFLDNPSIVTGILMLALAKKNTQKRHSQTSCFLFKMRF